MKYLKLKKTSPEERRKKERRKKMKEGTRVASNERRLKIEHLCAIVKQASKSRIISIILKDIITIAFTLHSSAVIQFSQKPKLPKT